MATHIALIGGMIRVMPRSESDEQVTDVQVSAVNVDTRAFAVSVVDGPDRGRRFMLDGASRILLGQSPACEIQLTDRGVSRRHAAFAVHVGRLHIADLESTNGTFVDGIAITGAYLRDGDVVRVGDTMLRVERDAAAVAATISDATSFGRLIGSSIAMRRLYPLCERLAATSVPAIVEGETGTGKEVLAEALHERGPRASRPFVVFDCTAIAPNLVEAELFGHERGAFTGAVSQRKGVFEQADGGTLFIDEIGDLDSALQPKLLRAIERSEVRRMGGNATIRSDVRIIAATRRDLDREVQLGRFRDDLFHRLAVARIELPPLRDRWGDVRTLALHFWRSLGGADEAFPEHLLPRWEDYAWPGNVRELRNAVTSQLALGDLAPTHGARTRNSEAPPNGTSEAVDPIVRLLAQELPLPLARRQLVDDFERRYLERVLARHGGDTAKAAEASGVARRYFQLLIARLRGE